ncbi:hypothetical protein HNE05_12125 [Aquipseudomonas campi]|uniref:Uncharacterized protein n=1 Tax=Aquipseudomonas campi TaxID=2731681 RepID=A0A6M8F9V2_9GAMM|nr:hypothetical protein [Pseudomonas campi]QKE64061.1 hypothetical protein HNE05_12125 [Pseudomonas campi]
MSKNPDMPLSELRLALRQRLFLQRQRIRHLLAPSGPADDVFPRSVTMRLITQRPAAALRLASQVALVLFGPRLVRGLGGALLLAKLLHSATHNPPRLPAPDDER